MRGTAMLGLAAVGVDFVRRAGGLGGGLLLEAGLLRGGGGFRGLRGFFVGSFFSHGD